VFIDELIFLLFFLRIISLVKLEVDFVTLDFFQNSSGRVDSYSGVVCFLLVFHNEETERAQQTDFDPIDTLLSPRFI